MTRWLLPAMANAPSDPKQLVDPDTLVLAHYEGDEEADEHIDWESLRAAIASATGKNVTTQPYVNSADGIARKSTPARFTWSHCTPPTCPTW